MRCLRSSARNCPVKSQRCTPLTLGQDEYTKIMTSKGETAAGAMAHHIRMQTFSAQLLVEHPGKGIFGAIDVGSGSYWWDYGQLRMYLKNNMLALNDSQEASALRTFLRIPPTMAVNSDTGATTVSESIVLASKVGSGSVEGSIFAHVNAGEVDVQNSLLVNVTARKIKASNCVVYNVVDDSEEGLVLGDGTVYTNVFVPGQEKLIMTSTTTTDGGKMFKRKMTCNPHSFMDVYTMNTTTDVVVANSTSSAAHADLASQL